MSTDKTAMSAPSKGEIQLQIALAKRDSIFSRIQNIFDRSKNVDDVASKESFLAAAACVDSLRHDFENSLYEYNYLNMQLNPTAKVEYQAWTAFEEMYTHIKHVVLTITPKQSDNANDKHYSLRKVRPSLPPIELVSFDGDIRTWPLFYASFKSTVHDNTALSNSEKLYYLIGKLSSKVQSAFAGITLCADNYDLIFQSLVDKYDNKRSLAATYLNQILDYNGSDNFDSFLDNFVSAVNALKNLKINDLTDFMLLHIALKKLNADTVHSFEMQYRKEKFPSFANLTDFIKDRARILQNQSLSSLQVSSSSSSNSAPRRAAAAGTRNAPPNNNNYRQSKLPQPQSYASTSSTQKCLCNDILHDHFYKCPAFNNMTPNNRFKCIKEHNACVNCLSIMHKASSCSSKSKCKCCNGKHHTLLHFDTQSSHTATHVVTSPVDTYAYAPASSSESTRGLPAHSNPQPAVPQPAVITHPTTRAAPAAATVAASSRDYSPANVSAPLSLCATSIAAPRPSTRDDTRILTAQCTSHTTVLLATAIVIIKDSSGKDCNVRCLLDSASQSNFMTLDCCKRLGLRVNKYENAHLKVKGIGGSEKTVNGTVSFQFNSRFNSNVNYNVSALLVDKITDNLPSAPVNVSALPFLQGLPLADDRFAAPGQIDVLVGAAVFPHLLLPGVIRSNSTAPPAIQTVLGYVIMGTVPALPTRESVSLACCSTTSTCERIDTLLRKFWEVDESPTATAPTQSPDEMECEYFFRETTERDKDSGRYIVALPFRADVFALGDSFENARKRFLCLERKLEAAPALRSAYDAVIREYLEKGYLSPAPAPCTELHENTYPQYIIPHHGVVRDDKTTTKLRTVLDASCKTSSGLSLNDVLHSGPNLQGDLFNIILNFRLFAIALSADCKQMFLQIVMQSRDRRYQRILYRFDPEEPLAVYEFNRVCFGIKSSPYHALRVVKQLIADDGELFPLAKEIASNYIYMDDIVFSVVSESEGISASSELIELFKRGQFDLVKWTSNSDTVLNDIPASHKVSEPVEFDKSAQQKILGLRWSKLDDCFEFQITAPDDNCTKRVILATVARIWDIMGFVAPVVLFAKLLIKELWLLKLEWDEHPPRHIIDIWQKFCAELPVLNKLRIPRHLGVVEGCTVRLLGFSDASERAYGAVVYMHVVHAEQATIKLVCAKSKVSPVKPLSIARLELCAAELLAKLIRRVHDTYNPRYNICEVYAFTDSKVTLCWLNSSPHRWQTFVANRVVKALDNLPAKHFYHVAGSDNPADCLSRGLMPDKLLDHPLWWQGPPWAKLDPSQWPINSIDRVTVDNLPEEKVNAHPATSDQVEKSFLEDLSTRFSSWSKLVRVLAYVYRFIKKLPRRESLTLTTNDLDFAERALIRDMQQRHFKQDLKHLNSDQQVSLHLRKLKPFLEDDIIRVGGRLINSAEDYNYKHPIVLPHHDHMIDLLIDYYHKRHLHAGPELLMSIMRQKFWILSARRIIRSRIHKCNVCFKHKPRPQFPIMADLPGQRVTQAEKAFTHTGCDYAGPIQYTPIRGRGVKSRKAYLCIFTCLTTRAIHIEVATDLSTVSFLAALKRFLARRGPVQCLYTDNGTNFVGARSYLRDLYNFLTKEYRSNFEDELAENRISFKFSPPSAPHFGGCWESMVKVVKNHLFKTIGQQILSYEELITVLTQVECLLNSRPLTVLSADASEPTALTPAHFLNTLPLKALPAPPVETTAEHLLQRHSLLDKLVQSFWRRWRAEYLHQLQTRQKWNLPSATIKIGTVVIIMNDNSPPLSWPLGMVERIHPSKDNVVRVVTLKTARGTLVRPVVRLCPLPTQ